MKMQETITEPYIRFVSKKDKYYFAVRVDFDDNVECKRVGNDDAVEISDDERLEWIEKRNVFLDKMLIVRKLYEKIRDIEAMRDGAIRYFQDDLDLEEIVDDWFLRSVKRIDIDYSDLEEEAHRIPYHVLKKYEEKIER